MMRLCFAYEERKIHIRSREEKEGYIKSSQTLIQKTNSNFAKEDMTFQYLFPAATAF